MFNFTHVLNPSTRKEYYIDRATLESDCGYDTSEDGANWFVVDLQSVDTEADDCICNLDLVVYNSGEAHITADLDINNRYRQGGCGSAEAPHRIRVTDCMVCGKTLVLCPYEGD